MTPTTAALVTMWRNELSRMHDSRHEEAKDKLIELLLDQVPPTVAVKAMEAAREERVEV